MGYPNIFSPSLGGLPGQGDHRRVVEAQCVELQKLWPLDEVGLVLSRHSHLWVPNSSFNCGYDLKVVATNGNT